MNGPLHAEEREGRRLSRPECSRKRLRAWLTGQPFETDAAITGVMWFFAVWLVFAWMGIAPLSNAYDLAFYALTAIGMGPYLAHARRKRASKREYVR